VLLPLFVDLLEKLALSWQLLYDIVSTKDVFEVHPLSLELEPLVNHVG